MERNPPLRFPPTRYGRPPNFPHDRTHMNIGASLRSLALGLTLLLAPGSAPAETSPKVALPKGVEHVTSVEGITEYKLPNGLRVLLFPDPSRPIITVNITYQVGSRH